MPTRVRRIWSRDLRLPPARQNIPSGRDVASTVAAMHSWTYIAAKLRTYDSSDLACRLAFVNASFGNVSPRKAR